jgi:TIR domain
MAYVFLSYSSRDTDLVKRLIASLNKAGHTVWVDRREIAGGARWPGEIVDAIEAAAAVLVALSPAAMDSEHVRKELALAVDATKLILPVWIERTTVSKKLKYYLADVQQIDLASDFEAGLQAVLSALEPIVKGKLDSILADPHLTTREKIDAWIKARAQFKDPDQVAIAALDERIKELDQQRAPIAAEIAALEAEEKKLRRTGVGPGTREGQRVERELAALRSTLAKLDVASGDERSRLVSKRFELSGARYDKVISSADELSARYTRIVHTILGDIREDPKKE